MALRSELGKVRGLGAAGAGTSHFLLQRATAIGLVLLITFLWASLLGHVGSDYATMIAWLRQPLVAVIVGAFIVVATLHVRLGLRTVIEDYVHDKGTKLISLLLVGAFTWLGAGFGLLCVLKIALGN